MNDLLIVKNITREGPGLLEDIAREAGLSVRIVDLSTGESFPSPTDYKAVVVLGGPDSANDQNAKIEQELSQIKIALKANMPYLGICLGMQLLVKAAGGEVLRATQKEAGFLDPKGQQSTIVLTDTGTVDPLFKGLSGSLPVFHLHGETVSLTDTMQLLGTGPYCKNQIVAVAPRAYGIQSHFELTEPMLLDWATHDPDLLPLGEEQLINQYHEIQSAYQQVGKTLFQNFLMLAGLC